MCENPVSHPAFPSPRPAAAHDLQACDRIYALAGVRNG